MRRSRLEPFRVSDAMLGIAATAIGMAWAQAHWHALDLFAGQYALKPSLNYWFLGDRPLYQMIRAQTKVGLYSATAIACPQMLLLLVLAQRGRRRGRIWRVRRPGAVACLAGTLVLLFELAHQAIKPAAAVHTFRVVTGGRPYLRLLGWDYHRFQELGMADPLRTTLIAMPRHAGFVVAGAWLALVLAGAWRPEPYWIDRAGRIVGVFWIVAACHFMLLPL